MCSNPWSGFVSLFTTLLVDLAFVSLAPFAADGTLCSTTNPADAVVMVHYRMQ